MFPTAHGVVSQGGTVAPVPFEPSDLTGLGLWLDAADLDTISLNGSAVTQWNDKSGATRNFVQATGSAQPALVPGARNGLPALRFDGSNDRLGLGSNSLLRAAPGVTAFVVAAPGNKAFQYAFWVEVGATNNVSRFRVNRSSVTGHQYRYTPTSTDSEGLQSGTAWTPGELACVTAHIDIANGTEAIRVNGSLAAQESSGTTGAFQNLNSNSSYVGADRADSNTYWLGDICEIVLYERALSVPEVALVEAYLLEKWGLP